MRDRGVIKGGRVRERERETIAQVNIKRNDSMAVILEQNKKTYVRLSNGSLTGKVKIKRKLLCFPLPLSLSLPFSLTG